jgi:hypothetical protein
VHSEQPEVFLETLRRFLTAVEAGGDDGQPGVR